MLPLRVSCNGLPLSISKTRVWQLCEWKPNKLIIRSINWQMNKIKAFPFTELQRPYVELGFIYVACELMIQVSRY